MNGPARPPEGRASFPGADPGQRPAGATVRAGGNAPGIRLPYEAPGGARGEAARLASPGGKP